MACLFSPYGATMAMRTESAPGSLKRGNCRRNVRQLIRLSFHECLIWYHVTRHRSKKSPSKITQTTFKVMLIYKIRDNNLIIKSRPAWDMWFFKRHSRVNGNPDDGNISTPWIWLPNPIPAPKNMPGLSCVLTVERTFSDGWVLSNCLAYFLGWFGLE